MNTATKLPRGIRERNGVLVAYLTINGKESKRTIGMCTVAAAIVQRAKWLEEIRLGTYNPKPAAADPVAKAEPISFAAIADRAIEYYKRHARCWDAVETRVKLFKVWFAGRAAASVTTIEIDEHLHANTGTLGLKWSRTTSNEYRVTLLRIYSLAIDKGLLTHNPATKADRYKGKARRKRVLLPHEEVALRAAITADYPDKMPELDLALNTGVRRSNIYGIFNKHRAHMEPLQWENVSLDFKVMTLPRSKSGEGYQLPLNQAAIAALKVLQARGDGTGQVVRKRSGLALKSCRRWFENCLATAKIENFCWHDLRHTFATRLRANRVPIEDIRHLLGHDIASMTELYANPDLGLLHEAVATLDRKPEQQTGTSNVTEIRKSDAA
jgi:integrase